MFSREKELFSREEELFSREEELFSREEELFSREENCFPARCGDMFSLGKRSSHGEKKASPAQDLATHDSDTTRYEISLTSASGQRIVLGNPL
jgi:hypothetical protein